MLKHMYDKQYEKAKSAKKKEEQAQQDELNQQNEINLQKQQIKEQKNQIMNKLRIGILKRIVESNMQKGQKLDKNILEQLMKL